MLLMNPVRRARRRSQIVRRLARATFAAALWLLAGGAHAQTNLDGWHAFGQTWLVWTDDPTFTSNETYAIYRSNEPISSLGGAELIGRIFPQDWQAERLKIVDSAALWSIPDGSGGTRALTAQEALFVYTPHEATDEYFAVVKHGATALGGGNTAGPIAQTTDPVQCHPVLTGVNAQHPFTVYAHWIDGRDDSESGRADYPVMGNAGFNGTAYLFAVVNPVGALPAGPVPAVLALHGGTGNF